MDRRTRHTLLGCGLTWTLLAAGCGDSGGPAPSSSANIQATADAAAPARLATVSIDPPSPSAASSSTAPVPFAAEGSVDWRLSRITELLAPPARLKEVVSDDGSRRQEDRTPQEITAERKSRLRQVVDLAGQAIAQTHADPERTTQFINAVHYLCEAHVELAVLGEADSARKLGEVADAIYREHPQSEAAVEAGHRLVDLAQRMADFYGRQDAEWVRAQGRQARLFAERFPKEENRVAVALIDAARACELAGLPGESRDCLKLIVERFPGTPYADEVVTDVRRLTLEGRRLAPEEFGGPTIDGGFLSIDHLRGKHVLVAFWMTDSPTFQADLPALRQLEETHRGKLEIIGVNLDTDEAKVDVFVEQQALAWRQIFDADPARRGVENPVARFYGVSAVPLYWLIGPDGTVLKAPADVRNLTIP
jgi:peroxiredoxin